MPEQAREIGVRVESMAQQWLLMANDSDHYRLAFDQPGSWSQKYNLVWDRLLELDLFPSSLRETEIAFYKTRQERYGLPLDNRSSYTKLDWLVWSATLADTQSDFETFIAPLFTWMNETESRVPLTDLYYADSGRQVSKMQARSVVGGVYIRMLYTSSAHEKWLNRKTVFA